MTRRDRRRPTPSASSRRRCSGGEAIEEDGQQVFFSRPFNHTGPRQDPSFSAPSFARQIALDRERRDAARDCRRESRRRARSARCPRHGACLCRHRRERTAGRIYNVCSGRRSRSAMCSPGLVANEPGTDHHPRRPHPLPAPRQSGAPGRSEPHRARVGLDASNPAGSNTSRTYLTIGGPWRNNSENACRCEVSTPL